MATPAERKRESMRKYQQTEKFKIYNRAIAKRARQLKKRKNARLRFQKQTMEELMNVVADTCAIKGVDYETVKEQYEAFMRFLHDPPAEPVV